MDYRQEWVSRLASVARLMIVYRATSTVNDKIYIGITVRPLAKRKAQHKYRAKAESVRGLPPFAKAIRKYGIDSFSWDVLECCHSLEALQKAEKRWIAELDSMNRRKGYNRTEGGGGSCGWVPSAETRKKISKGLQGRPCSVETRAKRSASLKGRKPSAASIAGTKNRVRSDEERERQRALMTGRSVTWSAQALENVRIAARRRVELGTSAKVKPDQVKKIWARRHAGESFATIGRSYDVTPASIFNFCKRFPVEVSLGKK